MVKSSKRWFDMAIAEIEDVINLVVAGRMSKKDAIEELQSLFEQKEKEVKELKKVV